MSRSRVLLTGATGFVGRAVLARLAADADVFAVTRRARPPRRADVSWVHADLRESLRVSTLPRRIDAVVHLAHLRAPAPGRGWDDCFAVNAGATAALLDYAHAAGATRFVYGSTGGIYGYRPAAIRETAPPRPFDRYTLSKWHGETIVTAERRLPTAIVRFFFPYGPGQVAGMVPRLADRIRAGDDIVLYAGGRHPHLNPVFISDACAVTLAALRAEPTLVVNCAGPEIVTVRELCAVMGRLLGRAPRFVRGRDPHVGDMVAATGRAARVLGVRPHVGIAEGLRQTLADPA